MRVLQLIDSLNSGGAERMAITIANELSPHISQSFLCCTREEGLLKETINNRVKYCFLNKRSSLDISFFWRLYGYLKNNNIQIMHAHSTSFFSASIMKLFLPSLKLIWHEHHGNRINQTRLNNFVLYFSSYFFNTIITVNKDLTHWCKKNLLTNHVVCIPNCVFFPINPEDHDIRKNEIICVANLRVPKNHLNLLRSFSQICKVFPDWKLILVGKVNSDEYYANVTNFINENKMDSSVEILGEQSNVYSRMIKAKVGVLSSDIEGLPMTLLEYGMSGLAVVCTDVGQCKVVVNKNGLVVPPNNSVALERALLSYIDNATKRERDARSFHKHVKRSYSFESVLPRILTVYQKVNY